MIFAMCSLSLSLLDFSFFGGVLQFLSIGTIEYDSGKSEASQGHEHHRRSAGHDHHRLEPTTSTVATRDEGTVVVGAQVHGCEHGGGKRS